jgi:hypothetical protein
VFLHDGFLDDEGNNEEGEDIDRRRMNDQL